MTDTFAAAPSTLEKSEFVLFGVPDESGSQQFAQVCGSAAAPASIRKASQLYSVYHRIVDGEKQHHIPNSSHGIAYEDFLLHDMGDIEKTDIAQTVEELRQSGKVPIALGGDHSITFDLFSAIHRLQEDVVLVYFDAHPDFLSSDTIGGHAYSTVVYDVVNLPGMAGDKIIQVGIRDIEPTEFQHIEQYGIHTVPALDFERYETGKIVQTIQNVIGDKPVYISVDLDVVDRAFVPGVSTPTPGGMSSRELLYILSELADRQSIVGLDIMEHVPETDVHQATGHLAAKIIIETVARQLKRA